MNPDQARKQIEESGIKIKPGHVYNIYTCSHIFDNDNDKNLIMHSRKAGTRHRCCPLPGCNKKPGVVERLVIKYKKCACGKERASMRLQKSTRCTSCYKTGFQPAAKKYKIRFKKEPMNIYRKPKRAFTVKQADKLNIPCLPSDILFKLHAGMYQ